MLDLIEIAVLMVKVMEYSNFAATILLYPVVIPILLQKTMVPVLQRMKNEGARDILGCFSCLVVFCAYPLLAFWMWPR